MSNIYQNPFHLSCRDLISSRAISAPLTFLDPILNRALSLNVLADVYDKMLNTTDPESALRSAFKNLSVTYEVKPNDLKRIPKTGPVVIVANHPFGGLEGMLLGALLLKVRSDVKIIGNSLLGRLKPLKDLFILVDPFGGSSAHKRNIAPMREAISWLQQGGVLVTFPSGTVSHLHWKKREIIDPEWSPTIARIIRRTNASVFPMYIHGRNSLFFQLAGFLHPLLRTALIPRELVNKRGKHFILHLGKCIAPVRLKALETDKDKIAYLRFRSYLLKNRGSNSSEERFNSLFPRKSGAKILQPIVQPQDTKLLTNEITLLPKRQLLVDSNEFSVYHAVAPQIPATLREIGRLREITFRAAREGTGKSIDLDRFDDYYTHLFIWNNKRLEIVGAYRIAKTDKVLAQFGVGGLYTNTLFHYSSDLLQQLGPLLELGRSFVSQEYQKSYLALHLLWKGIGTYISRNPSYSKLFGPVSINNEYESVSRQLIALFLQANKFEPKLARLFKARNPLRPVRVRGLDSGNISIVAKDISEISELIAEIEAHEKSVPILLRQYLRLGGKLLGFNVDPGFGCVLDGLILIDLMHTDLKILERYLGKEEVRIFRSYHESHVSLQKTGTAT